MRTREQMNKSKSWILTEVKVMDGYLEISEENTHASKHTHTNIE